MPSRPPLVATSFPQVPSVTRPHSHRSRRADRRGSGCGSENKKTKQAERPPRVSSPAAAGSAARPHRQQRGEEGAELRVACLCVPSESCSLFLKFLGLFALSRARNCCRLQSFVRSFSCRRHRRSVDHSTRADAHNSSSESSGSERSHSQSSSQKRHSRRRTRLRLPFAALSAPRSRHAAVSHTQTAAVAMVQSGGRGNGVHGANGGDTRAACCARRSRPSPC